MPLTALKGVNLPENGTEAALMITLCQYGTEPEADVKPRVDRK